MLSSGNSIDLQQAGFSAICSVIDERAVRGVQEKAFKDLPGTREISASRGARKNGALKDLHVNPIQWRRFTAAAGLLILIRQRTIP
jgi:hypothetical protein